MDSVLKIYKKYEEIILYGIVGVINTIISLSVYFICVNTFLNAEVALELQFANIISWVVGVTFAYVTNRIFVFKSKSKDILNEAISFVLSRIATLLIDMGIMFLFVTLLHQNDTLFKIISQIVVIVSNYVFSKLFVFKNGN